MRPQLFWGGLIVLLSGAVLYFVLFLYISVPFIVGGGVMMAASFLLSEGPPPISPPEGYKFCVFCSTSISIESERCSHCNGVQPRSR